MKGVVFNMLEELVCREHGDAVWDELLDAAMADGAYSSLGNYPDAEMMGLVKAAAAKLALSPDDVLGWFGRMLTLNTIIHPEVRKVYPDSTPPDFDFDTSSPEVLLIGYQSPRKLCALAHGFIEGAADRYGQDLAYEHLQCMHHGANKCLSRVKLAPTRAQ